MSLFFSRLTISPEIKIQSLTGVFLACLLDHFSLLLPFIIPCHSFRSTWTSSRPNVLSFQGFYICSSLCLRTSLPRHLCGFLPPFWPLLKSLTLFKTAFLLLPSLYSIPLPCFISTSLLYFEFVYYLFPFQNVSSLRERNFVLFISPVLRMVPCT